MHQILKNELKNQDFSHLITKVKFQIKYASDEKKIRSSIVSNFFPTLWNLLRVDKGFTLIRAYQI